MKKSSTLSLLFILFTFISCGDAKNTTGNDDDQLLTPQEFVGSWDGYIHGQATNIIIHPSGELNLYARGDKNEARLIRRKDGAIYMKNSGKGETIRMDVRSGAHRKERLTLHEEDGRAYHFKRSY